MKKERNGDRENERRGETRACAQSESGYIRPWGQNRIWLRVRRPYGGSRAPDRPRPRLVLSAVVSPDHLSPPTASFLKTCRTRLVTARVRATCSSGPSRVRGHRALYFGCAGRRGADDAFAPCSCILLDPSLLSCAIFDWPSLVYSLVGLFPCARCSPRRSAPRSSNSTPDTLPRSCGFILLPIICCASTIHNSCSDLSNAHPPFHHLRMHDLLPFFLEFCTFFLAFETIHYSGCLSALRRVSFSAHRPLCRSATPLST